MPVAVVLAAGSGRRLAPLTDLRPKALCPVANVAMVDHAIAFARSVTDDIAVNVNWGRDQMLQHLGDSVHVSVETGEALGTAGAIGNLVDWIDGRDVLVCNADAWHIADLADMYASWDHTRPRLLVSRNAQEDFDGYGFAGASLMPWEDVRALKAVPSGLWEVSWRQARAEGRLDVFEYEGPFFDCGTPHDYLEANLRIAGTDNVIGEGAVVEGSIHNTVLWPNVWVEPDETLHDCIRASDDLTVHVASEGNH